MSALKRSSSDPADSLSLAPSDCTPAERWIAVLGFAVAIVAYLPALRAGFIWDDDAHITQPALRSWSGLWRIWTEVGATQQYYPVLHSTFWVEHRLWGSAPFGYHLANIVLHLIAAFLLIILLRQLRVRGAMIAGCLFALHPVHVESVAWISEQKNTLSTLLYLGAALCYVRFDATRDRRAYLAAVAFFVLALLTKTVTATLPGALLVVIWWRHGRLSLRRDVLPLVPWIAVGASAGLFTAWVERTIIGADGTPFDLTFVQRLLLAGRVIEFYAGKLFWPSNLTFIYPHWTVAPQRVVAWLPLMAIVGLLVIFWRIRSHSRSPLVVALLFAGALFPVLGFFNVYPFKYSYVADHFQYLASIPVFTAAGSVLAGCHAFVPGLWRRGVWLVVCLLLVALGVSSQRQVQMYHDNRTLFRATIARNPECWMAYNNLGKELMGTKESLPEAIKHLERAIALHPNYPEAFNNLGLALTQSGRPREAVPLLETSLRLKPASYQANNNLGIALASSGRPAEALNAFARAAALNPTLPNIHENWAKAFLLLGRTAEAEERFAAAARLRQTTPP